jgi:hypothetical protein
MTEPLENPEDEKDWPWYFRLLKWPAELLQRIFKH